VVGGGVAKVATEAVPVVEDKTMLTLLPFMVLVVVTI
jgi:hypothetical protein